MPGLYRSETTRRLAGLVTAGAEVVEAAAAVEEGVRAEEGQDEVVTMAGGPDQEGVLGPWAISKEAVVSLHDSTRCDAEI